MYKEIHNLLKIENDKTTIFTNKELKMIDDYINELEAYKYNMDRVIAQRFMMNLQKENTELKEKVKNMENLQNRIDKAIEFTKKERKRENNTQPKDILDQQFKNGFTIALAQVEDILKESGE